MRRASTGSSSTSWRRFGGIRVEDNVVVTEDGHRNLTRPHRPSE